MAALRGEHPAFRRDRLLHAPLGDVPAPEVRLLLPGGEGGSAPTDPLLVVWLDGQPRDDEPAGRDALLILNAAPEPRRVRLPGPDVARAWFTAVDTARDPAVPDLSTETPVAAGAELTRPSRSFLALLA